MVNYILASYYHVMLMDTREVSYLIERLGNLARTDVRAACNEYGLKLVHFETLRYLTQCNRYSDTPLAVAEFLGLTKGTVSQTLKVLEQKGLLGRQDDAKDKRVVHLNPTAKGRRLVERIASVSTAVRETIVQGIGRIPVADNQVSLNSLRALLRSVQVANNYKTFAPCYTCRFNLKREIDYLCGLTNEPLAEHDVVLLCREHQYPLALEK